MSRRPPLRGGIRLPRRIQQELGLDLNGHGQRTSKNHARGGRAVGRTIRPHEEREKKRLKKPAGFTGHSRQDVGKAGSDDGDGSSASEQDLVMDERMVKSANRKRTLSSGQATVVSNGEPKAKSKSMKRVTNTTSPPSATSSTEERSPSPGLVLDKSSKTFQDRTAQDDAEILALEKKLGIRKQKRLPKSFDEDGLGDLLEGIDGEDGEASVKRKREGREWLERKRRRTQVEDEAEEDDSHGTGARHGEENEDSDSGASDLLEEDMKSPDSDDDEFDGFAPNEKQAEQVFQRKRENPYIAPTTDATTTSKYIPPSLRKQTSADATASHQLRRQLQGQLNKLSEANLLSILAEVEKLYQANARQDVTSALIDLLLFLFCDPAQLQNTFVILHASFVAALHKVNGTDFGAEFVAQVVDRFEDVHGKSEVQGGKQSVNLVSLLAHLYTFHVISADLVFDHIRILLETPSEMNAELLLRIVRDTGPQLRQDDPSSLKDIVLRMQNASAKAQSNGSTVSVRTKFMIETITDLKNNKLRTQVTTSGVSSEHITRMRKALGSLNSRNLRASEPLRIGLADLKNAEKRGKWWVIGASWKEVNNLDGSYPADDHEMSKHSNQDALEFQEEDLVLLARQHRMNTAVRRAIFITIMSAPDYQDAHLRLLKLRLKRSQEQEIPRVLMHCAGAEEKYNPYYGLIAKTLCRERRMMMSFQFSLWRFFRRMGESGDHSDSNGEEGEGEGEEVQLKEVVNTAKLFGHLVVDEVISLGILKTLNLFLAKEQARMFVEVLLIVVILKSQEGESNQRAERRLAGIFARCRDSPQVIPGLRHFLKTVIRKTDLVSSRAEGKLVKGGSGVALDMLKILTSGHSERM